MRDWRSTILATVAGIGVVLAAQTCPATRVGDFTLKDYLGASHSLSEWRDRRLVVVAFLGTECPLAKLYASRLVDLQAEFGPQDVAFVGIDSNQQDSLLEIGHYARIHKIDFPLLKDSAGKVADQFGATRTPEAFVLDRDGNVLYHGRIDDQFGVGYQRQNEVVRDLANALDEILAGKPVTNPVTEPVGCLIGRAKQKPPTGDITYTNQIARLVDQHCVRCHREGQIAPFTLTSYDDVSAWAETVCEVLDDGRMPPWHASPKYGHFANDAHMPGEEKQLFHRWVENGMPEGDPADLPEPIEYTEGWQIPKPDLVIPMPRPFTVPAKGTVPYQYFSVDTHFDEDKWVRAAEVRPGNAAVVHHAFLFYVPPGQDKIRAEDPLINSIAGFAPGAPASLWPDGYARLIPAGSRLVFQMHYTPSGSEQIDQSEVGLAFADAKQQPKEVKFNIAVNTDFRIPPGDPDFVVYSGSTLRHDTLLHAMIPHMHFRGKSFRFTAKYPDGSEEILLDVPRYDFNWQNAYQLVEPKLLPSGTNILCTGHFDNSEDNLNNPDPTKEVRWGDQTWDEMMLGSMVVSQPDSVVRGEYPKVLPTADDPRSCDVTFRFRPRRDAASIEAVYLAGSFNDWNPKGRKMNERDAEGYYRTTLRLKPGQYEYKFVINGTDWQTDPENPDDWGPYGNSLVRVPPPNSAQ
jgi:peroxiredoxin